MNNLISGRIYIKNRLKKKYFGTGTVEAVPKIANYSSENIYLFVSAYRVRHVFIVIQNLMQTGFSHWIYLVGIYSISTILQAIKVMQVYLTEKN